eukprot:g33884.t1
MFPVPVNPLPRCFFYLDPMDGFALSRGLHPDAYLQFTVFLLPALLRFTALSERGERQVIGDLHGVALSRHGAGGVTARTVPQYTSEAYFSPETQAIAPTPNVPPRPAATGDVVEIAGLQSTAEEGLVCYCCALMY